MKERDLADLSFDEMVKLAVEEELNAIVKGSPLASRVKATANLAALWRSEKTAKETRKFRSQTTVAR